MWVYAPYLSDRGAIFHSGELELSLLAADVAGRITSGSELFGSPCQHSGRVAMISDEWENSAKAYVAAGGSLDALDILTPRQYCKSSESYQFVVFSGFWSRRSQRTVEKLLKQEKAIPLFFLTNFDDSEFAYTHELSLLGIETLKQGFVIVPERLPQVAARFTDTKVAEVDTLSIAWL